MKGYRESFAGRLYLSFAGITAFVFLLYFSIDILRQHQALRRNIENKGTLLSSILSYHARAGLFAENREMLKSAVESVVQSRDVAAVRIYDSSYRHIYDYRAKGISEDIFMALPSGTEPNNTQDRRETAPVLTASGYLLFAAPVLLEVMSDDLFFDTGDPVRKHELIGYVHLAIDWNYHDRKIRRHSAYGLAIGLAIIAAGGLLIFLYIRRASNPLLLLADMVRAYGEGRPFRNLPVNSNDEIGQLTRAFNVMAQSLQEKEAERQRMESQFMQAQKMEAVGTLAGGIAHDFSNILSAIIGFSNILKIGMEKDDPARAQVDHILSASARASSLVQSLLAFSRQRIIDPKPVSVSDVIRSMEKILRRLIREDIDFRLELSDEVLVIMADAAQIDQALMNLCTNARDSMPEGGQLTIATRSVMLDKNFFRDDGTLRPGMYAGISVADTGIGMDAETVKRIFDPFFTTKEAGKGTGLGLSSVYGIVRQHEGYLDVRSEAGKGTSFTMYFPLISTGVEEKMETGEALLKKGTETILVAEDDEDVRIYITDILKIFGYKVIAVSNGDEAVNAFAANQGIDLLLLDVVMPRKNGREALEAIREISPDIKILFLSGYPSDVISKKGVLDKGLHYLSKPVTPEALLPKLREILESGTQ